MNKKKQQNLSTFMTKILRHTPLEFGVILDEHGFCEVEELLSAIQTQSYWEEAKKEDILEIVRTCSKQRYELQGNLIRCRYGHSYQEIPYEEKEPPEFLIHGTATNKLDLIFETGIKKMKRKHVHMSEGTHFASLSGRRHGDLVLLKVNSKKAFEDGVKFYYAGNEVWLSHYIDPKYVSHYQE